MMALFSKTSFQFGTRTIAWRLQPTPWLPVLVGLLAACAFLPGLPGGFLFDDYPNIVNNPLVQLRQVDLGGLGSIFGGKQVSGYGRSLPMLSFVIDYNRAGKVDVETFKTTNIVIHALTAGLLVWFYALVFRAARLLNLRLTSWVAAACALAWALHPLQVSSVLYVVQRLQTMGTLFLVLSLCAYLKWRLNQQKGAHADAWGAASMLAWALALLCKEDSLLLPVYTLALELTVLGFRSKDEAATRSLKKAYLLCTLFVLAIGIGWVLPNLWQWDTYPGRNFSTVERLVTQGRVICLYLWQILVPLPSHMPFYYDWLEPSRGLTQPWTTLPALLVLAAILAWAWHVRDTRPLFSLGTFLYFGAQLITSNAINLELAFEHRNHFALVGAVLAVASLLGATFKTLRLNAVGRAIILSMILLLLGTGAVVRSHTWSDNLLIARNAIEFSPHSARAWIDLCDGTFNAGGGIRAAHNARLNEAIDICSNGAAANPESLNPVAILIALKTLRGDVSPADWASYLERLQNVRMTPDNARATLILTYYAGLGVNIQKDPLVKALNLLDTRKPLQPQMLDEVGTSILDDLHAPEAAMPFFRKAVMRLPPGHEYARMMSEEFRRRGRFDLAAQMDAADRHRKGLSSI